MILQTYPTTFQVVFFLKGNVVQELLDFISFQRMSDKTGRKSALGQERTTAGH